MAITMIPPADARKGVAAQLLEDIERFLTDHDMTPTMFGRRAVNDDRVVFRLREGKGLHSETIDKLRRFMEGHGK